MNKTEIKEIKFQIGETEVSTTIEQAKKLQALLNDLFGKKEIIKEIIIRQEECPPYYYPPYPYQPPIWIGVNDKYTDVYGTISYSNHAVTLSTKE